MVRKIIPDNLYVKFIIRSFIYEDTPIYVGALMGRGLWFLLRHLWSWRLGQLTCELVADQRPWDQGLIVLRNPLCL